MNAMAGAESCSRVLIVGRHPELLEALADVVTDAPFLQLTGVVCLPDTELDLASVRYPEVILLDLHTGDFGGEVIDDINEHFPGSRLVALTAYDDHVTVHRMRAAGIRECVVKGTDLIEFLRSMAKI